MNARALTGSALAAALKKAVNPTISAALRRNAERFRQGVMEAEGDVPSVSLGTRVSLDMTVSGENLFAREFGALDAAADPVIVPAINRLRRRPR